MNFDAQMRRQFKRQARENIQRRKWSAMLAVLLVVIPALLLTSIYQIEMGQFTPLLQNDSLEMSKMYTALRGVYKVLGLYLLASILVLEPLKFGMKHYMVARARGQYENVGIVMCCFSSIRKYITAVTIGLSIFVRSIGWYILLSIAVGVLLTASIAVPVSAVVCMPLMIVVTIHVALKIRRYDGAYICMINVPDGSAWRATGACAAIFDGHLWELFCFDLSFILWYLFGIVTLGIGMLYTEAYHETAFVNYFDARTAEHAKKLREQEPKTPDVPQE